MTKFFSLTLAFIILSAPAMLRAEKAPQAVVKYANDMLVKYETDSIIVDAVKAENAKNKSLSQIQEMDKHWKNTPGIVDYMKAIMESPCGKHLSEIRNSKPFFSEIFVMDNQGANVCMTDKTSDYWQGDEAKFQESFKGGAGAVFIDDVEFDDSAQTYLVQVSVPVKDNGKVIGAITFGIDVDALE